MRRYIPVAFVIAAMAVILLLAVGFSSADPDGLERVAEDLGFASAAQEAPMSVLADYRVDAIGGDISTIVAGVIGIGIVGGGVWLLGRSLRRRTADPDAS